MKKILIVLFALLLLVACQPQESSSPSEVTASFLNSLKEMDFHRAKAVSDTALIDEISELEALINRSKSSEAMIKKLLTLIDYEIVSEDVSEENATVTLKMQGLSEEAMENITDKLMMAGFEVADPTDVEAVSDAVLTAVEEIDPASLEKTYREVELSLQQTGDEWQFSEDTLTRLTEALFP